MKPYQIRGLNNEVRSVINLNHVTLVETCGTSKVRFWLQGLSSPVDEVFNTPEQAKAFVADFHLRFVP